jgi:hypothetical protein
MDAAMLWAIAEIVPPEWYGGDTAVIERLAEQILARRRRVRDLIGSFRDSDRQPFPMWDKRSNVVVPGQFVEGAAGKFLM